MTYGAIEQAAQQAGLLLMGALLPRLQKVKSLENGTLVLLGAGRAFWPLFDRSAEHLDGLPDPVDRWSKRVIGGLAEALGASTSHFPSDGPPYAPFIDWALKSGRFHTSPVGMMVHDQVGMMISLRGALHFEQELDIPSATRASPCLTCDEPCTTACPVGALGADHPYDLAACHGFLDSPSGADCMARGCAARRACPISSGAGRTDAQSAFHMRAFHPS